MPDLPDTWTLTFRPLPYPADTPAADRVPVPLRVRRLLKLALRRLGLRCINIGGQSSVQILVLNPANGQPLSARLIDGELYLPCGPPSTIAPVEIVYDPQFILELRDALATQKRLEGLGYRVEMKEVPHAG